jgi:hypothetical protein
VSEKLTNVGAPHLDFEMWEATKAAPLLSFLVLPRPASVQGFNPSRKRVAKHGPLGTFVRYDDCLMRFNNYMSTVFPGLSLKPPLFYRWPIGIRFELGKEEPELTYDEVTMRRACALYEAVFRPGDLGLIVSALTRYVTLSKGGIRSRQGRYRRHRPTVFQLSRRYSLGLRGPAGRECHASEEDDLREITTLRWTEIAARRIDYQFILKAIANASYYPRRPATSDRIYFVNPTRNVILHMYDDRGMDLIAARRSDLQPIYVEHKDWVLDYDRRRISETFE